MHIKSVDVIIPTYKPGAELELLLGSLLRQTVRPDHILLINTQAPGVDIREYVRIYEAEAVKDAGAASERGIKAEDAGDERSRTEAGNGPCMGTSRGLIRTWEIPAEEFDHGATRDRMARESDAEVILFMTQDAIPQNERLIEELLRPMEDDQVAVTYARQLPGKNCSRAERFTRSFNYPGRDRKKTAADLPQLGIKTYFCSDVCAAYRRDRYLEAGGFPHPVIFNEDMLMTAALLQRGYAVYYASRARVIHSHNYTGKEYLKRNFDLGVSQAMNPEVFRDLPSEGEGLKLVLATLKFLVRHGTLRDTVGLFTTSVAKYLGYRLGRSYESLPKRWILKCTANLRYWKNREEL